MALQCRTCGGIYDDIGADGIAYNHVCPPIPAAKVRRLDGSIVIVARDQVAKDDVVLSELMLTRRNARNENPDVSQKAVDGKRPIVSDGAGVDVLATAAPILVGLPNAVQPRTTPAP